MSNKAWGKINPLDQLIRQTLKLGMDQGTFLKIEFIYGFEKFNTRPYHNYETWSGGYRVTDELHDIIVSAEDLDDALYAWKRQRECEHDFGIGDPPRRAVMCQKKCGKVNRAKKEAI